MTLPFFIGKNDVIYNEFTRAKTLNNISLHQILTLGNIAWNTGILIALSIPNLPISKLILDNNIAIKTYSNANTDSIIFSSYDHPENTISLYQDTINQHFIPNIPKEFSTYANYPNAVRLLFLHEYFHFLQCNNFYSLKIYSMASLNEIAAYSFARKITCIPFE